MARVLYTLEGRMRMKSNSFTDILYAAIILSFWELNIILSVKCFVKRFNPFLLYGSLILHNIDFQKILPFIYWHLIFSKNVHKLNIHISSSKSVLNNERIKALLMKTLGNILLFIYSGWRISNTELPLKRCKCHLE